MEINLDKGIRNIVFDLGQVLLKYDWPSYLKSFGYDDKTYEIVADSIFRSPVWEMGDEGVVTPEEWVELFVANAPACKKEILEVSAGFADVICQMDYTEAWIRYFKERGFHLYFLSNYSEKLYNDTKHHMDFMKELDGGIFSYKVKCIKPGEKIYHILLDTYQLKPEETVFFDDREDNVKTAEKLGLKGVVFTPDVAYNMLRKV